MKHNIKHEEETKSDVNDEDVEFSGKSSTFKELVMNQLNRIAILSSCELRGGYFSLTETKSGAEKEIYVQDSRSALQNAIYFLGILLSYKFDEPMKKVFELFKTELELQKKTFLKTTSLNENEILGEAFYEKAEDKVRLEELKITRLGIYLELFRNICLFLGRLNFLELGGDIF